MCLETLWFAVIVAEHSILVGLHTGMIFQMYPVGSQGLLVGPCLSISVMLPGTISLPYSRSTHAQGTACYQQWIRYDWMNLLITWRNSATEPSHWLDHESGMSSHRRSDTVLMSLRSSKHLYHREFYSSFLIFLTFFFPCLPGAHRAYGCMHLIRLHCYYFLLINQLTFCLIYYLLLYSYI